MPSITPHLMRAVVAAFAVSGAAVTPVAAAGNAPAPRPPADAADRWLGDWNGALDAGGRRLHLTFHLNRDAQGRLGGTLDSPDQGASGIPLDSVSSAGDTLRVTLLHGGARFTGAFAAEGIRGTWYQSGFGFPLDLGRGAATVRVRPQDPVPPFPYAARDTTVANAAAGVSLACTVTLPPGKGPFPAVLLITGSGAQDRDEALLGHRPFLVLADHLTRHGFAVMRCDDRGTARSTGVFAAATTRDFVGDARAEFEALRRWPGVDPRRVGLVGHSEGGVIAPWLAASDPRVAFVVLLAGPGIPGDSLLVLQTEAIERASGAGDSSVAATGALEHRLLADIIAGADSAALARGLATRIADRLRGQGRSGADADAVAAMQTRMLLSPWFRAFIAHDPRPDLRRTRCPVLAMNGSLDAQVPAAENLPAVAAALREGGNRDVRIVELPGLNHLFQTATTGLPAEYGAIDETFAPAALDTLTDWLVAHARGRTDERRETRHRPGT
ncbi:MAG TPA: alpha/beta hydrolase [Candidatus Eisenbacteria bacterium]|nr:alpha/beta hydrolase [Candidatus Eisenbacteria bacterium]